MLRKLCLCLTISLMIAGTLAGINLLTAGNTKSVECENVFTSGIYPEYYRQLNSYIKQHPLYRASRQGSTDLDVRFQQLVDSLEEPHEGTPQQYRYKHEIFVNQLRQIIADMEYSNAAEENASKQLLKGIINWIFLKPDLYVEVEGYLSGYLSPLTSNQPVLDYLPIAQKNLYQKLKLSRQKQKNVLPEDHYLSGNLPLKISEGKIKLIRMAQPLLGNTYLSSWLSVPKASPEFLSFLKQQQNHLYINLMRRNGVEGVLSSALENLELSFLQLSLVTLDKDSDFYWQRGSLFPEYMENDQFKSQFLRKLVEPNGNYYWSSHLDMPIWEKRLQSLVEEVERGFFSDRITLNKAERQDFMELTYLAIINALTESIQPDSFNITCRQSMDRGPSLMALWLFQQHAINDAELVTMLFAPPLLIHQRTSHAPRLIRFISAAKRL